MGKLRPKQERFCAEYVIDFNATQAAVRAGYSAKTARVIGPQNLSKLAIAQRVRELTEKIQQKTEITAQFLRDRSLELLERSLQHAPVLDDKGNPVLILTPAGKLAAAYTFQAANAAKAIDLLAKHIGWFKEDNDQKRDLGLSEFTNLSPAARAAIIGVIREYSGNGAGDRAQTDAGSEPSPNAGVTH